MTLLEDPWEPALLVLRVQIVEVDPGGNVGGILILILEAFFHAGQVDQVQHLAPVNGMFFLNQLRCILYCFFYKLHLLNLISHKLQLNIQ